MVFSDLRRFQTLRPKCDIKEPGSDSVTEWESCPIPNPGLEICKAQGQKAVIMHGVCTVESCVPPPGTCQGYTNCCVNLAGHALHCWGNAACGCCYRSWHDCSQISLSLALPDSLMQLVMMIPSRSQTASMFA